MSVLPALLAAVLPLPPLPSATAPETTTNQAISVQFDRFGAFNVRLELDATPSNNLEVAIGTDETHLLVTQETEYPGTLLFLR